jgi:hypothetical protein
MKWINLIVQRNLEHLHLHIGASNIYSKLPTSIFICTTLVSLYLCEFFIEFSSDKFQLPSLKTLHLVAIVFSEVRDFVWLIAGCPILENLQVYDICCYGFDSLTIQDYKSLRFPRLTRAHISEALCDFPAKAFTNSESLSIDTNTIMYTHDKVRINMNMMHATQSM